MHLPAQHTLHPHPLMEGVQVSYHAHRAHPLVRELYSPTAGVPVRDMISGYESSAFMRQHAPPPRHDRVA